MRNNNKYITVCLLSMLALYNDFSQNNTKSDTSFIAFDLHEQKRHQRTALIKLRLI